MEDKRVSDLPAAESIGDADVFVMEQNGEAKSVTGGKVKSLLGGKEIKAINCTDTDETFSMILSVEGGDPIPQIIRFDADGYPTSIETNGKTVSINWVR